MGVTASQKIIFLLAMGLDMECYPHLGITSFTRLVRHMGLVIITFSNLNFEIQLLIKKLHRNDIETCSKWHVVGETFLFPMHHYIITEQVHIMGYAWE